MVLFTIFEAMAKSKVGNITGLTEQELLAEIDELEAKLDRANRIINRVRQVVEDWNDYDYPADELQEALLL